ncbi:uncharacterized protein LOC102809565 [Saccoglossus kowalevskii]|uniref:Flocculation protein FLO11-like n=1 Tax=Saccoglossus kowalevskii TaxID=10224 RepID=A0ABM0MAP1_SACKO|nr:PREDICTED: flocculation protein FLO11-like [Saccoglossus kowalevskii]
MDVRWKTLIVRAGTDHDAFTNQKCGDRIDNNLKILKEIWMSCPPVRLARYVSVHLQVTNFLNLAEIMVFGIDMCQHPGIPDNGYLLSASIGAAVHAGHKLQYECNSGYELSGNDTIICTSDAVWSGEIPICSGVATTYATLETPSTMVTTEITTDVMPVSITTQSDVTTDVTSAPINTQPDVTTNVFTAYDTTKPGITTDLTLAPITTQSGITTDVTSTPITTQTDVITDVTSMPITTEPGTATDSTLAPITTQPDISTYVTSAPITTQPGITTDVTSTPITTQPDVSTDLTSAPISTQPDITTDVASAPITTQPDVTTNVFTAYDTTKPGITTDLTLAPITTQTDVITDVTSTSITTQPDVITDVNSAPITTLPDVTADITTVPGFVSTTSQINTNVFTPPASSVQSTNDQGKAIDRNNQYGSQIDELSLLSLLVLVPVLIFIILYIAQWRFGKRIFTKVIPRKSVTVSEMKKDLKIAWK